MARVRPPFSCLLGAIVIGAVNAAATDPERDEFKYPSVSVRPK